MGVLTFKSPHIEKRVRERLKTLEPLTLTQEDLLQIECISISESYIGDIRCTAIIRIWDTEMSSYFCAYSWMSLNLDYRELIKTDGWEEDLKYFSHIHTFYCDAQIPPELFYYFTNLENLGLSNINISDWSFLLGFQILYTVSLDKCGSEGNQAIKNICELYAAQKEKGKNKVRPEDIPLVSFVAVIGMGVNDLSPFKRLGEPFATSADLCELNLSNNAISDISPLSGFRIDTLILNDNTISRREEDLAVAERLLAAERARLASTRGYTVDEFQNNMRDAIKKGANAHAE